MSKYIVADAALNTIDRIVELYPSELEKIKQAFLEMPAADVEPVRKWISVDERLPEGENVLLCTRSKNGSRNIDKGYYLEGRWVYRGHAEVTHWMSLPELPKMDGGSE